MTGNKNLLSMLVENDFGVGKLGDGNSYKISGVRELELKTKQGCIEKMTEVYFVSGLQTNMLSVGHLLRKGYDIHFHDMYCNLSRNNHLIASVGVASNNIFSLGLKNKNLSCFFGVDKRISKLWHDRYGHLNYGDLEVLLKKMMVRGFPIIDRLSDICETCQFGKQHKNSFPSQSSWQAKRLLHLIHSDLCGPTKVLSLGGNIYFISFIDDYS